MILLVKRDITPNDFPSRYGGVHLDSIVSTVTLCACGLTVQDGRDGTVWCGMSRRELEGGNETRQFLVPHSRYILCLFRGLVLNFSPCMMQLKHDAMGLGTTTISVSGLSHVTVRRSAQNTQ